jgi:hypothetical protein
MRMKLRDYTARFPGRPEPVPAEHAGEWVAWNEDCTGILAHGIRMDEVRQQAVARGCMRPVLQKVPRGPYVYVGGA